MKEKKLYIDILRIVAILMVFHFHFVLALGDGQGFLVKYASGEWGCVGTSLFFLISGNCLARNYGQNFEAKKFYLKRFLAIFPAFYISYILVCFWRVASCWNVVFACKYTRTTTCLEKYYGYLYFSCCDATGRLFDKRE